ncbi:MAG: hypothetical protein KF799_10630 [Bdellovibrionales bacterium]|nr:hypothetical protein [Bdellovibrionales bacterium]
MKSVTEFWSVHLQKGLKTKADLVAAGKTPEEIAPAIGEAHKYEGDKLKHFVNALEVASTITEPDLMRILVGSLGEGENAPPKATKIEEFVYVPEFKAAPKAISLTKNDPRGGGKKKDAGKGKGPKESPWGLTPEQKAAKKAASKAANKPS